MAFGIDFGTTNSAVSYKGNAITTADVKPFPSIVAIHRLKQNDVRCGPDVKAHREVMAKDYHIITSVKRFLDPKGPPFEPFRAAGVIWDPEHIVTALFSELRRFVEKNKHLTEGKSLDEAVVSIPVGFPVGSRRTLRRAAEAAGVRISSFISEPTAAFLHCRPDLPVSTHVAVFDWGGGTLDVSVLRIHGDRVEELATEGWGTADDFIDKLVAVWAHDRIAKTRPGVPEFHNVPLADRDLLLSRCEDLKIRLSTTDRESVQVLLDRYAGHDHVPLELTRVALTELVSPLIEDAIGKLRVALDHARLSWEKLEHLLLVGGSSRIISLRNRLEDILPARIYQPETESDRADFVVAQGASELARQPGHDERHHLMQRICLRMSNDEDQDLFQPGAPFNGHPHPTYLGVVGHSPHRHCVLGAFDRSKGP